MGLKSWVKDRVSDVVKFAGLDPPDTKAIDKSTAVTQDLRDRFIQEYETDAPRDVPQVDAAKAGRTVIDPVTNVERTTIEPTRDVQAPDLGQAEGITAADIPDADRVRAGQAMSVTVNAPRINRGDIDPIRQRQVGAIDTLEAAARGEAPSVAETQLRSGLQSIESAQRSLAAGARGQNTAGAARRAARNILSAQMGYNAQQAALRAQEQATARGALAGALSDVRGSDQDLAKTAAGMELDAGKFSAAGEMDVGKFNVDLGTKTDVGNADRTVDVSKTRAGLEQDARKFTAGERNERDVVAGKMKLDADTGSADRAARRDIAQGEIATGEKRQDAAAANTRATHQADVDADREKFNTGEANRVAVGNADRKMEGRQLDDTRRAGLRDDAIGASRAVTDDEATKVGIREDGKKRRTEIVTGFAKSIAQGAGSASGGTGSPASVASPTAPKNHASDVRMKKNIAPADDAIMSFLESIGDDDHPRKHASADPRYDIGGFLDAMADEVEPITFSYKRTDAPGTAPGKRYGLGAQDLERTGPVGRSLVEDTPTGKVINAGHAIGPILAGMAEMARRLRDVEKRRPAR